MNEERGIDQLPMGWKWMKLGDACEVVTGTTPPKSDLTNYGSDIPFFKPPHLWNGMINDTEERLSFKGAEKARVVPPNTVLVTCIGNLGRTGLIKRNAAFNQQLNAIIENESINGKYIFYQAQSPLFKKQLEELATGTTVSIVNKSNFETIDIPVPPKELQLEIVSKIEELFSETDKGIEEIKTAHQLLKVYRQAVLKWAFEGKLTNDDVNNGELPKSWKRVNLNEVGSLFCGQSSSVSEVNKEGRGVLYVTGPEQWNGRHIEQTKWTEFPKRIVPEGCIFITVKGAGVGKLFPGIACAIGRDVYAYLPNKELNFKYSYYALKHSVDLIVMQAQGDIPGLAKNHILDHEIGVCSITEQEQIVQEIESRLSVCDKIEETITNSLKQAEALRQSILKKAFEGRLISYT